LSQTARELHASLINGTERIAIPQVTVGETLQLRFPHYNSEIVLSRTAERDSWGIGRSSVVETPMHGTFLTTLGDYRFLAGDFVGDELWLLRFDGAHALLFRARAEASGELRGDFWSSDDWHETWTAKRDDTAALPDAFALSAAREGASLVAVKVRDLLGNERVLDDPAWRGRPRVVELFGSWCPNCHDHGAYLAELHRRYADRGLVVFGIAFEHDDDFARSVRQVATFRDRHRIDYPLFLAGLSDKAKATLSLGVLDKVRAFPTTLFLDGEGRIRRVYQGWTGPAAAADHARLRERFESVIEELLGDR
jgi:thiol-disulfide isomerase/thioredoxin